MPQESGLPVSNLKDYIVRSRQAGYEDSVIIDNLKRSNWPLDIIDAAILSANETILPVIKAPVLPVQSAGQSTASKETTNVQSNPGSQMNQQVKIEPETKAEQKAKEQKEKSNGISFWAVLSFFFSPIPIIGLLITMTAFDDMTKNKKSGMILALLALIVNFIVVGLIVYIAYQIFTLNPDQMSGAAKYLNDKFKFV
jgi:hypothetical protein